MTLEEAAPFLIWLIDPRMLSAVPLRADRTVSELASGVQPRRGEAGHEVSVRGELLLTNQFKALMAEDCDNPFRGGIAPHGLTVINLRPSAQLSPGKVTAIDDIAAIQNLKDKGR